MSSGVAAGMTSLLAEMNWMRDVVEREGFVGVVGDDDADGDEAVLDVGQAEPGAELGVGAGVGGDGDVLGGVSVDGEVLGGGFGVGRVTRLVGGVGSRDADQKGKDEAWVSEGRHALR